MAQIYDNTTNLEALLAKANALPDALDTSDATAESTEILSGETAYVNGTKVTGNMPNNGSVAQTIDGLNTKSVTVPAGYTSGGMIALDSTIDDTASAQATTIAEIEALLEGKSVGGGGSGVTVDTCTIEMTGHVTNMTPAYNYAPLLLTTVYENNEFSPRFSTGYQESTIRIENVVCGSLVFARGYTTLIFKEGGGLEIIQACGASSSVGYQFILRAPTEAGATGTIVITED